VDSDENQRKNSEARRKEQREKEERAELERKQKEYEERERKREEEREKREKELQEKEMQRKQEKEKIEREIKRGEEEDKKRRASKQEEKNLVTMQTEETNGPRSMAKEIEFKIILIGDAGVGKTNFVSRYMSDSFEMQSKSTIGIEFVIKHVWMSDGQKVKLNMWDTAGQERFRSITRNYYRGADGVFLMYDNSHPPSLQSITDWFEDVKSHNESPPRYFMIGNKIDLAVECSTFVTEAEASQVANAYDLQVINTSAKTGHNVALAFQSLVEGIYAKWLKEKNAYLPVMPKQQLAPLVPLQPQPSKGCC